MKLRKKLAVLGLVGVMGATAGFGTLAYFTDYKTATNVFTVGKLGIQLDEKLYDEENAIDVVPGRIIPKNPMVTVKADSVESYVRMVVTMPSELYKASNLSTSGGKKLISFYYAEVTRIEDTIDNMAINITYKEGMDPIWNLVNTPDTKAEKVTLIYDYKNTIPATDSNEQLNELFSYVQISTELTNQKNEENEYDVLIDKLNKFDIKVDAYAVQKEGFNTAVTAFDTGFPTVF